MEDDQAREEGHLVSSGLRLLAPWASAAAIVEATQKDLDRRCRWKKGGVRKKSPENRLMEDPIKITGEK